MRKSVLLVLAAGLLIASDVTKGDKEAIQGTWAIVSMERDGKPLPLKEGFSVTFKGDQYTVPLAGGFTQSTRGTYRFDPTKKPGTVDLIPADGPNKGRTIQGIYQLDGDTLRTSFDPSGKGRPTEFSSKGGQVLILHKREKSK